MPKKTRREHTLASSPSSVRMRNRLGRTVRSARLKEGLSLAKLGEKIGGISAPQLYNIEKGDSFPSFVVYVALCRKFGFRNIPLLD